MRQWLAIGILWAASIGNAFAATYYAVEVLVFALDDPAATEYLAPDPGTPDFSEARTIAEHGFTEKDPDGGGLGPEKYTLRSRANAEILYHGRWVQTMANRVSPSKIRITAPAPIEGEPPLLDGVLEIGAGRFIHIGFDLRTRGPRLPPSRTAAGGTGDYGAAYGRMDRRISQSEGARGISRSPLQVAPPDDSQPEYPFYRLTAHRKMRPRELHYIDHPKIGVLVEVMR